MHAERASSIRDGVGGCVDLVLGSVADELKQGGAGSCGDALAAAMGCEDIACGACSTKDVDACLQASAANECDAYELASNATNGPCASIRGDAAPAAVSACFPQSDVDDVAFLNVFCGAGP